MKNTQKGKKTLNKNSTEPVGKKGKSTKSNNQPEKVEEAAEEINFTPLKTNHMYNKQACLANMSSNLISYLSKLLNLSDLFQFRKTNKRNRLVIDKKTSMLNRFIQLQKYKIENSHSFSKKKFFIYKENYDLLEKLFLNISSGLSKEEVKYLKQEFMCTLKVDNDLEIEEGEDYKLKLVSLMASFPKCPLERLCYTGIPNTKQLKYLTKIVKFNKTIKSLSMNYTPSSKENFEEFYNYLKENKTIKDLNLLEFVSFDSEDEIVENNKSSLFKNLSENTSIETLSSPLDFKEKEVQNFISNNKNIKHLTIGDSEQNLKCKYKCFKNNNVIQTLEFEDCRFSDIAMSNFCLSLTPNEKEPSKNLTKINTLIFNSSLYNCSKESFVCLGVLISKSKTITKLDFKEVIDGGKLSTMFKNIGEKGNIKILKFHGLDLKGFNGLLEFLTTNKTVEEIEVDNILFVHPNFQQEDHRRIGMIHMRNLDDPDISFISKVLKENKVLKTFRVDEFCQMARCIDKAFQLRSSERIISSIFK